jgi:hypothetical protein
VKVVPFQRGREPWRGIIPGELRASVGSKPPFGQWRTLTWSKTLKARVGAWTVACSPCLRLRFRGCVAGAASSQRHEGIGAGDSARLRGRSKAL